MDEFILCVGLMLSPGPKYFANKTDQVSSICSGCTCVGNSYLTSLRCSTLSRRRHHFLHISGQRRGFPSQEDPFVDRWRRRLFLPLWLGVLLRRVVVHVRDGRRRQQHLAILTSRSRTGHGRRRRPLSAAIRRQRPRRRVDDGDIRRPKRELRSDAVIAYWGPTTSSSSASR